ncbi:unnamed protein product [Protopolystoma xenopodis]|uniref:Uncharacterized protein n=1 Tax=Protopolystoma xenopodis TaxID=117903 RepID=A0A448WAK7_9PLAT|nr:unnamed protein product [Protopolystoma xenopodis]
MGMFNAHSPTLEIITHTIDSGLVSTSDTPFHDGGHFNQPTYFGFSLYTGRHALPTRGEFNSHHLLSRLALLTLHFPNLRLIWSVTPYCTAELFSELKMGRLEPTVGKLPQVLSLWIFVIMLSINLAKLPEAALSDILLLSILHLNTICWQLMTWNHPIFYTFLGHVR